MRKKTNRFCNLRKWKDFYKNSLPYLNVLRLSCVVHGPIYGRLMGFYVNGFLSFAFFQAFVGKRSFFQSCEQIFAAETYTFHFVF